MISTNLHKTLVVPTQLEYHIWDLNLNLIIVVMKASKITKSYGNNTPTFVKKTMNR